MITVKFPRRVKSWSFLWWLKCVIVCKYFSFQNGFIFLKPLYVFLPSAVLRIYCPEFPSLILIIHQPASLLLISTQILAAAWTGSLFTCWNNRCKGVCEWQDKKLGTILAWSLRKMLRNISAFHIGIYSTSPSTVYTVQMLHFKSANIASPICQSWNSF